MRNNIRDPIKAGLRYPGNYDDYRKGKAKILRRRIARRRAARAMMRDAGV